MISGNQALEPIHCALRRSIAAVSDEVNVQRQRSVSYKLPLAELDRIGREEAFVLNISKQANKELLDAVYEYVRTLPAYDVSLVPIRKTKAPEGLW